MPEQAAQALWAALRALRDRASSARAALDLPFSYRETSRALNKPPYAVSLHAQRIGEWLRDSPHDSRIPSPDSHDEVLALVRLWSLWAGEDQSLRQGHWDALLEAARSERNPPPAGLVAAAVGWPIRDVTNPFALEVHQAIDAGAQDAHLPVMPAYVKREHDRQLCTVVQAALTGTSGVAILVGESSSGKTRACWEAIQGMPSHWRVWHPIAPTHPEAVLAGLDRMSPRTVIWLNEAQQYLLTSGPDGEHVAAQLRDLLRNPRRGPVLVLGTMWPEYWNALAGESRSGGTLHQSARALLSMNTIRVPSRFVGQDSEALSAAAATDPRMAEAKRRAGDGRITQYLAGVPALLDRYESAPPGARALIHAAMDARRMGHRPELPLEMLEEAAHGYLTDDEWDNLEDSWTADALAYLSAPCRGARGPLTRIRPRPDGGLDRQERYRLADYLEQHGRVARAFAAPPGSFWTAAEARGSIGDLTTLGVRAESHWRLRDAESLYQKAAREGSRLAVHRLAELRDSLGEHDAAERLYAELAANGDSEALETLASRRAEAGDWSEAERLALSAISSEDRSALTSLAGAHSAAGHREDAERLYRLCLEFEQADGHALLCLARHYAEVPDFEQAEAFAIQAADAGEKHAFGMLGRLLEDSGDAVGAERFFRMAVEAGDEGALESLAWYRYDTGDLEGAALLYRQAVKAGHLDAPLVLSQLREEAGDLVESSQILNNAMKIDEARALVMLGRPLADAGDISQAENNYRQAIAIGSDIAPRELGRLLQGLGRHQETEQLAIQTGHVSILESLADLMTESGEWDEAERLALLAANGGSFGALQRLAERHVGEARWDRLRRYGLDANGDFSEAWTFS